MKRTVFALMLVLASVVLVRANDLTRTAWVATQPNEDVDELVLNFDDNGKCQMILSRDDTEEEGGHVVKIHFVLTLPGTYSKKGNDITINLNKEQATLNIDYDVAGVSDEMRALFDQLMQSELEKMKPELQQDILKSFPSSIDDLKIISLARDRLVIRWYDSGYALTFYPTAKG